VSTQAAPAEEGQSLEQKIQRALELFRRGRKHWPIVAACLALGAGGGVVAAMKAKKVYQSETMIVYKEAVDQRGVGSGDIEHPDVEGELKKLLSSRSEMLKLVDELKILREFREFQAPAQLFETFQGKFLMRQKGGDTFWFTYEDSDALRTQRTVERITDYLMKTYSENRNKKLKSTLIYLEENVAKSRKRLAEIANELGRFAKDHPEIVSNAEGTATMGGVTVNVGQRDKGKKGPKRTIIMTPEIAALAREKGALVSQRNLLLGPVAAPKEAAPEGPNPCEEDLKEAKREYDLRKAEYTDQHPDVIRAKKRLEGAKAACARAKRPAGSAASAAVVSSDPQVIELNKKIGELDDRIARASARASGARDKGSASVTPAVPVGTPKAPKDLMGEWQRINLEEKIAKGELEDLESRKQKEDLRIRGQLVESFFEIRDPALLPQKPIKPVKKKIFGMGFGLGLFLGLGYAVARVLLDPKIYDVTDLQAASSLPVLAVIPRAGVARSGRKA